MNSPVVNPGDDARQGLFLAGHQGETGLFQGQRGSSRQGAQAGAVFEPDQAPGGQAPKTVTAGGEAGLEVCHRGRAGLLQVIKERPGLGP